MCVCIYKVQVNCTNLHKNRERAWCHTCMDSANRQHLEGGLEPMLELKDWTLLSEISSDTQNMYRGGRWLNTSHDGGPDGKTSPSNCNWSVSTSGEGGGGDTTWSTNRSASGNSELWGLQMLKYPEYKVLLGSVQIPVFNCLKETVPHFGKNNFRSVQ